MGYFIESTKVNNLLEIYQMQKLDFEIDTLKHTRNSK